MRQESGYEYEDLPPEHRHLANKPNTLGIVGFVFAFCLSPIGLILSLIALLRAPRGFASAGVIVGLIGSIIWGIIAASVFVALPAFRDISQIVEEFQTIKDAVNTYKSNNTDTLPPDLASLPLTADQTSDPWGTPYRYQLSEDGKSWSITIAGPDGAFDDARDVTITQDSNPGDFGRTLGETFGEDILKHRTGAK